MRKSHKGLRIILRKFVPISRNLPACSWLQSRNICGTGMTSRQEKPCAVFRESEKNPAAVRKVCPNNRRHRKNNMRRFIFCSLKIWEYRRTRTALRSPCECNTEECDGQKVGRITWRKPCTGKRTGN